MHVLLPLLQPKNGCHILYNGQQVTVRNGSVPFVLIYVDVSSSPRAIRILALEEDNETYGRHQLRLDDRQSVPVCHTRDHQELDLISSKHRAQRLHSLDEGWAPQASNVFQRRFALYYFDPSVRQRQYFSRMDYCSFDVANQKVAQKRHAQMDTPRLGETI